MMVVLVNLLLLLVLPTGHGEQTASNRTLTRLFHEEGNFSDTLGTIKYVAYSALANCIVMFGLVGNLLNLVVLTRPNLKGVMYVYLLALAVSNLCVLITAIPGLYDIYTGLEDGTYTTAFYSAHVKLPLINSFMASSVYIIICMTVNRYISIYRPSQFQRIHTHKNARISIVCSFAGGMLFHIPLCFFQEVVCRDWMEEESNQTTCLYWIAQEYEEVASTWMGTVYLYSSEAVLRFGPITVLGILNSLIIYKFQQIAKKRQRLKGYTGGAGGGTAASSRVETTPPSSPAPSNVITSASRVSISHDGQLIEKMTDAKLPSTVTRTKSSRTSTRRRSLQSPEERMLVIVLISIVVLFVCCTTPAAILSLFFTTKFDNDFGFQVFRAVANNLELLNFALNFYIYCLCSAEIRRAFVSVFTNIVGVLIKDKGGGGGSGGEVVKFDQTTK